MIDFALRSSTRCMLKKKLSLILPPPLLFLILYALGLNACADTRAAWTGRRAQPPSAA